MNGEEELRMDGEEEELLVLWGVNVMCLSWGLGYCAI